jgi:GH15 family glucan-1,4-alpha-glucosidase
VKLEDYGFIGDMATAALVGRNGSIDWWCVPRFDSAACFAGLLGTDDNGCWRIAPQGEPLLGVQRYRGDTLILETEFSTPTGTVRLVDCLPPHGGNQIVRLVQGVGGEVAMEMRLIIRFDYGSTVPWVRHQGDMLNAIAGPNALVLRCPVPTHGEDLTTVARFTVRSGDRIPFVLQWYESHNPVPVPINAEQCIAAAEEYWLKWSARCTYRGPWREAVMRSLITLKALVYAPTGGIVAAPTTSLPENLGGVRNWDYRYCWLRDATFTLFSFLEAGYTDEAVAWIDWLLRAVAGDPAKLQIMYGAAGERALPELELTHLAGYENSKPVRIGNAAATQFQLDVYGEVMDTMHKAATLGIPPGLDSWRLLRHLVGFTAENWKLPDEGIWEMRGPRRHFTHSKVMAWVALDRGIKIAEQFGLEGDLATWRAAREEVHQSVCREGYNEQRKSFTQFYGSDQLDASLLMMPLVGFLPANDPRMRNTIEAMQRDLVADGLVLRYHPQKSAAIDGLPPGEGTFLPCSFWLVDCLHLLGRSEEARELFEKLLRLRNSLGLLAEEYDTRYNRQVGNYPQAFSHVGLVNSAQNLSRGIGPADERAGTVTLGNPVPIDSKP